MKTECILCGKEKEGKYKSRDFICHVCSKQLGKMIEKMRLKRSLSLSEASEELGLSSERLRQLEAGKARKYSSYKNLFKTYSTLPIKSLEFSIPETPPNANAFMRMHWAVRNSLKEKWHWMVAQQILRLKAELGEINTFDEEKTQISVEISFEKASEIGDLQNYVTPIDKLIIDALCKLRILNDDKKLLPSIKITKEGYKRTYVKIEERNEEK